MSKLDSHNQGRIVKTSEKINAVADLIQERGWRRGSEGWMWQRGESVCLEGAMLAVEQVPVVWHPSEYSAEGADVVIECDVYQAVLSYLLTDPARWDDLEEAVEYGAKPRLCAWNDMHGRSVEEVIEVLRAAAAVQEAREHANEKQEVGV